ncbi:flavoprotein [Saccharopolyspora spinosa]|uniref:Flavoprotein n=1 Tax=Saccharopolyspora spinosa TaxID=60894 RepID=A0A2N3XR25_SACSN|nr:flavoprotein [Saccharopolyspora spinosa]PKW13113.1 flavoprotein [Saccharopolyspora spinosa]
MSEWTLGLIGSAAGGVEKIRPALIEPAIARGWRVAVTLTPTAGWWLREFGETERIEQVTGLPCRVESRLPSDGRPHPPIDCYLACPATANTVVKLALGIADNQALTTLGEAIGTPETPVVIFPKINITQVRHPAWKSHTETLREAGVELLTGDDYWPLHDPREKREIPWLQILDAAESAVCGTRASGGPPTSCR